VASSPTEGGTLSEPTHHLQISSRHTPIANVVAIRGDADLYGAPEIGEALGAAAAGASAVVVDLGAVTFLDSTILALLLKSLRELRAREIPFTIVCDAPQILRIFELTGLDARFRVVPTLSEALRGVVVESYAA
jgi:anti-sigma B factor antagonist